MFRPHQTPAEVTDLEDETLTAANGAVRSVQSATVELPAEALDELWNSRYLERLARTYWAYLSRVTLHLIRIHYRPDGRDVVFLFKPFRLLSFAAPVYDLSGDSGTVTWSIAGGLLVSRPGEGLLQIEVHRLPTLGGDDLSTAKVRIDVEVSNFYPAIAEKISSHLYRWTQSKIHVLVTYGFLRRLAKGELEPSVAKRFEDA
ncbi:MAG: hypothetical protein NTY57_05490 [Solirubrobacterales bacterium]|nr:hypothetical protein [Solirubrobacterales bacterium]